MAIDLICLGPGKHEINISENLIISSSEEEDLPPRELNSLIIFLLVSNPCNLNFFYLFKFNAICIPIFPKPIKPIFISI